MRCGIAVGVAALTLVATTAGAQGGGTRAEVFFGGGGFVVDEKVYSFDVGATAWLTEAVGGGRGPRSPACWASLRPMAGCCSTRPSGISAGCGAALGLAAGRLSSPEPPPSVGFGPTGVRVGMTIDF